jgi:chemotaxis response regulator CheB
MQNRDGSFPVKRVRVLVANRPRLMRDVVIATIMDQPDIEIVGEVLDEDGLADAIEDSQPDVLILALDTPERQSVQCGFLLGRYPRMRILALGPEQNRAMHYWANVEVRTKSLESSESGILGVLRQRPAILNTQGNGRAQ